ncbi:MAG: ROK family protein [Actinobacteria bacterium]|nr:ROK family protein [Actinomycetota bacterium]
MSHVIAVHITGTRIKAGVIEHDRILSSAVTRTPVTDSAADVLGAVIFAIEAALSEPAVSSLGEPPLALGVGCPGPIDQAAEHVSPLTIPAWREYPLGQLLTERFRLPVHIRNDAVCLAIGEQRIGAGRGSDNLLAVTLGAGVGGGLILGGKPFFGRSGNAGHVGHMIVAPDGNPCDCGGVGCLQTVASVPGVVGSARGAGWQGETGDLLDAVRAADPAVVAACEAAGDALGVSLASLVNVLDLELIALAGPLTTVAPWLLPRVTEVLARHAVLEYTSGCRIVLSRPDTGLVGAAALCQPLVT